MQGSYDEVSLAYLTLYRLHKCYDARYEEFVNKRYKEPEDGNFADATREILKAVPGDSNIGDDEEMEPVAAIAVHLADIIS